MQLVFDRKLSHVLSNRMWSILSSFRRRPKETFTLGSLSRRFSFWKPCELIIISNWLQAQRTTCSEQITYLTKLFPRKITLDNLCFVNKKRHWAEYNMDGIIFSKWVSDEKITTVGTIPNDNTWTCWQYDYLNMRAVADPGRHAPSRPCKNKSLKKWPPKAAA